MTLAIPFDNSFARLPEQFHVRQAPVPVAAPELLLLNLPLAAELGLDPEALRAPEGVAVLAGNTVADGAEPLAQAYAGHQFGGFVPTLGDGRAVLLGEIVGLDGHRRDLQLKGAGLTAFSRPGSDGRSPLGPVLREFIVSEAMHALGVPSTRALAAVATGEQVRRERLLPGGVLTRVAASHLRVGTFQYFAARRDTKALQILTDYTIARHYPEAQGPLGLLAAVIARQSRLVAGWLGLGFVHGVMNTDNTSISGETIDFGPCAFMDTFQPGAVFSSIDQHGRYAYDKQPDILGWNLAQFASCLVPLIAEDPDTAINAAQTAMEAYPEQLQAAWLGVFRGKIGLCDEASEDGDLIAGLLRCMAEGQADFTNTFRALAGSSARDQFLDPTAFDAWESVWRARVARGAEPSNVAARLRAANPAIIPRNHRVEQAIAAAMEGDLGPTVRLVEALATPYQDPAAQDLTWPPAPDEQVLRTFCGT